ncbi:MAG: sigma 54-interacting transcriptional regulator, partial [Gemmatimonadales bacterium]
GSETTDAVVNVRFICATNRNVDAAVKSGELREDLYYRLCVVPIHLPALRERREDIPILADYFLGTFWAKHRSPGARRPEFTEAALRALAAYPWRGNVRELQNAIEHAAVLAEPGARLQPSDLPLREETPESATGAPDAPAESNPASLIATLLGESYHTARDRVIAQFETQYLTWLVNRAGGNMSQAARVAGVDRTTLYRLMERHGLHRNPRAGWVVESAPETTPPTDPAVDPAVVTSGEMAVPMAPGDSDRGSAA